MVRKGVKVFEGFGVIPNDIGELKKTVSRQRLNILDLNDEIKKEKKKNKMKDIRISNMRKLFHQRLHMLIEETKVEEIAL